MATTKTTKPATKKTVVKVGHVKAPDALVTAKAKATVTQRPAAKKADKAEAQVPAPKKTKEERAAEKQHRADTNKLMATYSSVVVSTWFGQKSVQAMMNKPKIGPETALCLVFIGVHGAKGCSRLGIEFNLRPSWFDRREAELLAQMGCASLADEKLAKYVEKPVTADDYRRFNFVLTKKGQDLFGLIKRLVLQPRGKGSFLF
jgi:hypothetical protein